MTAPPTIIPFFKGRVALHAILRAAGIGPGDQVLLPGYTCVVVPNAIQYTGATPVFLDIENQTYNLDSTRLESHKGQTWVPGKARALIIQHTYGIPADVERLLAFARKYELLVIEDSCHALSSTWQGKPVGSWGDAAFFSSQWSKPVTTGLGGWAQINDPELRAQVLQIQNEYPAPPMLKALILEIQFLAYNALSSPRLYWLIQSLYRTLGAMGLAIGSSSLEELACALPQDYQLGMHRLQSRRLRQLLNNLDHHIEIRRRNKSIIEQELVRHNLPTVKQPSETDVVFLRYPVPVANKEEVLTAARKERVQLGDWFLSPIHPNLEKWELAGYRPGTCPVAEQASREVINIPTDHRFSEAEIRRTVNFLGRVARPRPRSSCQESSS
ncbi:hypothetical protein CSB20_12490 [bacterium DOLZORAL124_64_63]|nr:MAG: hypothetical protein CSB20_12490 [bacterium DOLZORAL124_64_63]